MQLIYVLQTEPHFMGQSWLNRKSDANVYGSAVVLDHLQRRKLFSDLSKCSARDVSLAHDAGICAHLSYAARVGARPSISRVRCQV